MLEDARDIGSERHSYLLRMFMDKGRPVFTFQGQPVKEWTPTLLEGHNVKVNGRECLLKVDDNKVYTKERFNGKFVRLKLPLYAIIKANN